jgi:hypothetical protein
MLYMEQGQVQEGVALAEGGVDAAGRNLGTSRRKQGLGFQT